MSTSGSRSDVIQAIYDTLITMDPARLTPLAELGATSSERAEAEALFLASKEAATGYQARRLEAWRLLVARRYDAPPSWAQLFDDLSPDRHARLAELYDALPEGAQAEYDRRFGRPQS